MADYLHEHTSFGGLADTDDLREGAHQYAPRLSTQLAQGIHLRVGCRSNGVRRVAGQDTAPHPAR